MPAQKLKCSVCKAEFYATRIDTLYCSPKCRYAVRMENAKFETPRIPQTDFPGITYSRLRKRWEVRIKEEQNWKYVGSFRILPEAIKFWESLQI